MSDATTFTPGPTPNTVRAADGTIRTAPDGWVLLPPGDAALTRRVKAAGNYWVVQEKRGRKVFSKGVWAPATTIDRIRAELETERSTESFTKRKEANARRRGKAQAEYVGDFFGAVVTFLAFHSNYAALAERLARAVTDHATPVGSGTVARTKRIPVEQRAEAAVIAWMRHTTTGYDGMVIPRVKGKRREVRRMLARRSQELLHSYRRGEPVGEGCPLKLALAAGPSGEGHAYPERSVEEGAMKETESDRIRTAVAKNPRKMTLQLARDLGVPEAEVIRAFPPDRVTELDIARWEELLQGLEAFGSVRVLVSNGAATIEVDGQFGGFSTTGEFFNVQTDTLDMHIRWRELAAAFAIEKPGHMDGMATRSFQFFDQTGAAAFKVFLNFGGPIPPEREARFSELRTKFKR